MPATDPWHRVTLIGIGVALMASGVYVAGESLREGQREAYLPATGAGQTPSIPVESGVFRRATKALTYEAAPTAPNTQRSLATYYGRRAYPGAPPTVPHPVEHDGSYGGKTCLTCHADGGFVPKLKAFTPVVPHPELISCLQCHVKVETTRQFGATRWQPVAPPAIHRAALPEGPPQIPHDLQMRENCLSCHAGPAAVPELQVSHPERVSCRQCHALLAEETSWIRPSSGSR